MFAFEGYSHQLENRRQASKNMYHTKLPLTIYGQEYATEEAEAVAHEIALNSDAMQ